jgi:hypothetical protein
MIPNLSITRKSTSDENPGKENEIPLIKFMKLETKLINSFSFYE